MENNIQNNENEVINEKDVNQATTAEQPVTEEVKNTEEKTFDGAESQSQTYYNFSNGGGAAPSAPAVSAEADKAKSKSMTAMILGIVAVVTSCICLCLPVGLVLGIISLVFCSKAKKLSPEKKYDGMALAGLICSICAIVIYGLWLFIYGVGFIEILSHPEEYAEIFEINY